MNNITLKTMIDGERLTLYHLTKNILGYDRLDEIHRTWCDDYESQKISGTTRFCNLKPRGTFKSTIFTIGNTIDLLIDDYVQHDGVFTLNILIASATDSLAANLLSEIVEQLQRNEKLLDIFDPERKGYIARSNKNGIWFKNRRISKEPNIACVGALASIVGSHYPVLILDDISNQDDRESMAIRERKWRWFVDVLSIQTISEQSLLMVTGTVWHSADVIQKLIRMNEELDDSFKYHIEVDGVYEDDGETLRYPSIYNHAELENLKKTKGPLQFAAQYLNVVLSSETMIFDFNTFSFYNETDKNPDSRIDFRNYRHYLYCDPALGNELDYSVILIGALVDNSLYLRHAFISNTTKSSQLIKQIEMLNDKYECLKCGIEANGFQSLLVERIEEINENNKKSNKRIMRIEEVKNFKNKQVRIESIEPLLASGKVIFREDWETAYPLLIEQIVNYPATTHDDAPDALEGLIRITINNKFRNTNSLDANTLQKMCQSINMRK